MSRRRRTLARMELDRAAQDRLACEVVDVILDQGGIWSSVEDALQQRYSGEDLDDAMTAAVGLILVCQEPGGPAFLRQMRDRRRRLVPAAPRGSRWRPFRATG